LDDRHLIFCLKGPKQIRLPGSIGDQVSLLPLSSVVEGVSLEGLKYPLTNACLTMGSTQGISNVMVTDAADIEIENGILLVTIAHAL
jgi:thiamine pyrophosphokinase